MLITVLQMAADYTSGPLCRRAAQQICTGLADVTWFPADLSGEAARYLHMTTLWTILAVWLALQLPLGVLIGKTIKFGTAEPERRRAPSRARRYNHHGVVWC